MNEEDVAYMLRLKIDELNEVLKKAEELGMDVYLNAEKNGSKGDLSRLTTPRLSVSQIKKLTVY